MNLANRFSAIFLGLLLVSVSAGAQQDSIDAYVRLEMRYEGIPGLALGVYDRGTVIRASGFGLANVELGVAVQPNTVFNSGSLAKQFVATAVMMLVEEGKVGLDDSVTRYFPDAPASWKPIEIKNLLSHTSGLADYSTDELTGRGAPFDFRQDFTDDELRKKFYALPIAFASDTDWAYCNMNYVLLGMVIQKVTGMPWGEFLAQRIFKPLGMTDTRVDDLRAIVPGRASGYVMESNELRNADWTAQTWNSTADGNLYLSVVDMAKWDDALLSAKLLKRSTLNQMWTAFPLKDGSSNSGGYGFGFYIRSVNGHRLIDHEGIWQGFHDYSALYVDDGIQVVVLTNLAYPLSRPQDIGKVVAGLYRPALRPQDILPITDSHPALTKHLFLALEAAVAGDFGPKDYTSEELEKLKSIPQVREALKEQGPISSFQLVGEKTQDGRRELLYRARMSTRIFTFTFVLAEDGKIATMSGSS